MTVKRGTIPLDSVTEEFYVRTRLNDDHVLHLASLYEAGTKLPPIKVSTERNRIIDGRHRVAALRLLEKKAVDVEWDDEKDNGMLLAHALLANIGGSLPPSNADIVYAIQQMIEAGMVRSIVMKQFTEFWPPAVVRRYISDAESALAKARITKAKTAVVDNGMTVNEAAMTFNIKLDVLKNALTGSKKRKSTAGEIKAGLTSIFKSRGSSMGQVMRRVQQKLEDGELSPNQVGGILEHLEKCCQSTMYSARDWRKRFEASIRQGKK